MIIELILGLIVGTIAIYFGFKVCFEDQDKKYEQEYEKECLKGGW